MIAKESILRHKNKDACNDDCKQYVGRIHHNICIRVLQNIHESLGLVPLQLPSQGQIFVAVACCYIGKIAYELIITIV